MRVETAQQLSAMTNQFYETVAASFSATRDAPWAGWQRVLEEAGLSSASDKHVRVVDLACGNLRFERFLAESLAGGEYERAVDAYAFDNCDELAFVSETPGVSVRHTHLDIMRTLYAHEDLNLVSDASLADLAVCFGFMHHVPLPEHRAAVLHSLVEATSPGGTIAVSFWQLSKNDRLLKKAQLTTTEEASRLGLDDLDPRDYLLGWQDRTDVVRYCHDFTEEEIDALAVSVYPSAIEVARYSADGKTGNLNRYLILRRTPPVGG